MRYAIGGVELPVEIVHFAHDEVENALARASTRCPFLGGAACAEQ